MRTRNVLITSLAATIAALSIGAVGAQAAGVDLIGTRAIKNDTVRSIDVKDGTLQAADMSADTLTALQGQQGSQGPVGPQGPQGAPGDPASDQLGGYSTGLNVGPTAITKIGGTYSTNATELGKITIEEDGMYLISSYGYFDRINEGSAGYEAPTTDTYLQLSVRGPAEAGHAGTAFSPAVPHKGYTETTAQSVQVVHAKAGDVFTVRAFGYNEDRSGFGSEGYKAGSVPQFTAAAAVSAVRIG